MQHNSILYHSNLTIITLGGLYFTGPKDICSVYTNYKKDWFPKNVKTVDTGLSEVA